MLFSKNRSEYLGLLNYQASVEQQITYNRKNDYFLLINKYLNQLITPSEFQIEFLEMEKKMQRTQIKFFFFSCRESRRIFQFNGSNL